jgi:hypothetical protein
VTQQEENRKSREKGHVESKMTTWSYLSRSEVVCHHQINPLFQSRTGFDLEEFWGP